MRKKSRSFYNKRDGQDSQFTQSPSVNYTGQEKSQETDRLSFNMPNDTPKLRKPRVDNRVKFIHDDLINEVKEYQDKLLSKEPTFIELNELDLAEDSANKDNTDRLNYTHEQFYKKFEETFISPRRVSSDDTNSSLHGSSVINNTPQKNSIFKIKRVKEEKSSSIEDEKKVNQISLVQEKNTCDTCVPPINTSSQSNVPMNEVPVSVSRVYDANVTNNSSNTNEVNNANSISNASTASSHIEISDTYASQQMDIPHDIPFDIDDYHKPELDEKFLLNSNDHNVSDTLPPVYDFEIENDSENSLASPMSTIKGIFSRRNKKSKNATSNTELSLNNEQIETVASTQASPEITKSTLNNSGASLDTLDISHLSDEELEQLTKLLESQVYSSENSTNTQSITVDKISAPNTIESKINLSDAGTTSRSTEYNVTTIDEKNYIKTADLKKKMFEDLRQKNAQNNKNSSISTVDNNVPSRNVQLNNKQTSHLEAQTEAHLIDREEDYKKNKLSKFFRDFQSELSKPTETDSEDNKKDKSLILSFDEVLEPIKDNKLTAFLFATKKKKNDKELEDANNKNDKSDKYDTQSKTSMSPNLNEGDSVDSKNDFSSDAISQSDQSLSSQNKSSSDEYSLSEEDKNETSSTAKSSLKNKLLSFKKTLLSNISRDIEESDSSSFYQKNSEIPSSEADTLVEEMQERAKFDQLLEDDPEAAAAFIAEKVKKDYKDDIISSAVESPQFRLSKMADRLNSKLKSDIESIRGEINKDKSVAYDKLEEAAINYLEEENKRLLESSSDNNEDSETADNLKLMDEIVKNYKQQSEEVENIFSRIRKGEERLSKSNSQFAKRKSLFEDSADAIALRDEVLEEDNEDINQDSLDKIDNSYNDIDDYDYEAKLLGSDELIETTTTTKDKSTLIDKSQEIKTGLKSVFSLLHDLIFKAQKLRITPGLSKQSIDRLKLRHKLRNESATLLLLYTVVLFLATIFTHLLPFSFSNIRNQGIFMYVLSEILRQIFLLLFPAILVTYKLRVPLRRISGKRKLSSSTLIISCLTGMPLAILLTSVKRLLDFAIHNKNAFGVNSYLTYVSSSSASDLIILIIVSSILCSFSEEIFARGILLTGMLRSGRIYTSLFLSSFIYALIAGDRYIIYAMSAGMLFAWLRYSLGSIYSSMLSHLSFNATLILLTSRLSIFTSDLNQSTSSIEVFAAVLSAVISLVVLLVLLSYLNGEKQFNDDREFPRFSREKSWSPVNKKFLISLGFLLLFIVWHGL